MRVSCQDRAYGEPDRARQPSAARTPLEVAASALAASAARALATETTVLVLAADTCRFGRTLAALGPGAFTLAFTLAFAGTIVTPRSAVVAAIAAERLGVDFLGAWLLDLARVAL